MRPIFDRLPEKGYRDNQTADALTDWADYSLLSMADLLALFSLYVNPVTCPKAALEWLSWLAGFTVWDTEWYETVKRLLLLNSAFLWRNRGTQAAIARVLDCHGLTYDIWQQSDLRLSFKLPGRFGRSDMSYFLRLPLGYHKAGKEYREAQRTLDTFNPAIVKAKVCYQGFYLGFSSLSDPLFS